MYQVYIFYIIKIKKIFILVVLVLPTERARFKQHILNSTRPYRGGNNKLYTFVRENGGWGNMAWGSILTSPNHIIQFLNQNPNYRLNLHKIYMLRSLTQFEVRVHEQAILSYLKPNLNSSNFVNYSFINWNNGYTPTVQNKIQIKVFNASILSAGTIKNSDIIQNIGLVTEFDSIGNAAIGLGVSKTTISRYINTISSLESPLLDLDVLIIDPNRPLTNKTVSYFDTNLLYQIKDFDLYSLPIGKLIALNSNKDPVNYFGVFTNAAEAALKLDNKTEYKYISRYINLERTVEVTSNKVKVYFVMNPIYKENISLRRRPESPRNTKAIILVDTLNNTAIHYETVKLMLQDLGLKSTGATSIVKRYMNPTKLYKQQYEFYYAEEYKGDITSFRKES